MINQSVMLVVNASYLATSLVLSNSLTQLQLIIAALTGLTAIASVSTWVTLLTLDVVASGIYTWQNIWSVISTQQSLYSFIANVCSPLTFLMFSLLYIDPLPSGFS